MICPNCGVLLPEGVKVCGNCGHAVSGGDLEKTVVEPSMFKTDIAVAKTKVVSPPEEQPVFGWLVIIDGKDRWREFRLPCEERQFIIGSDDSCDIKIQEAERLHASIRIREGSIFITDLDTEKGTLLNGKEVVREEVKHGDEIQLGSVRLKFVRFPE